MTKESGVRERDATTLVVVRERVQETTGNLEGIITKDLLFPRKRQRKEVESPIYKFLIFSKVKKTKEIISISSCVPAECITSYHTYAIAFKEELKRRPESDLQGERR